MEPIAHLACLAMALHLHSAGAQTAHLPTPPPVVWGLMPLFATDAAWDSDH